MTAEFAFTLPFGIVAGFVLSLLFELRRVLVRFRVALQRTRLPVKMRATPNVAKRNGSESTSAKLWGIDIGNKCAI
jgi:hypothetical protein